MDYVIYSTCFLLPSALTSVIIIIYLFLYSRIPTRKWTVFLLFPIIALVFSFYYFAIRILFLTAAERVSELEIPLVFEPFLYGILFIYIYQHQKPTQANSSDFTISDISVSFIDDI